MQGSISASRGIIIYHVLMIDVQCTTRAATLVHVCSCAVIPPVFRSVKAVGARVTTCHARIALMRLRTLHRRSDGAKPWCEAKGA